MIKTFIINFLFPFPLFFYFTFGSVVLLWVRKLRLARMLLTLAVVILTLASTPLFTDPFVASLEQKYPPLSDEEVQVQRNHVHAIVVLGSGYSGRTDFPLGARQSPSQLFRVIDGVRLYHLLPQAHLIVSGGGGLPPEAEGMSALLQSLGVKKEDILLEPRSLNTHQQAMFIRTMTPETKIFLVTSAIHMPRAVFLFEKVGFHPIPSPAEYLLTREKSVLRSLLPSLKTLQSSQMAVYEHLGYFKERFL